MSDTQTAAPEGSRHTRDWRARGLLALDFAAWLAFVAFFLAVADVGLRQAMFADDYSLLGLAKQQPSVWGYLAHMYRNWSFTWPSLLLERIFVQHQVVFAATNAAAFVALAALSVANGLGRLPRWQRSDLYAIGFVSCLYWFTLPAMAEAVFWRMGTAVYLWSLVILLAAVFPLIRWLRTPVAAEPLSRRDVFGIALVVPLAFTAGSSHLQVASALGLLTCVAAASAYRHGLIKRLPWHIIAWAIGIAVGVLVMLSAPGNFVRATHEGTTAPGQAQAQAAAMTFGLWALTLSRYFWSFVFDHLSRLLPWAAVILGAALPVSALDRDTVTDKRAPGPHRPWLLWVALALASTAPFIAMPKFGAERTMTIPFVLLVVAALSALQSGGRARALDRAAPALASGLMVLLLVVTFASAQSAYRAAGAVTAQLRARDVFVSQQRAKGVTDITVPRLSVPLTYGAFVKDITDDPEYWTNRLMAQRYGVNSIHTAQQVKP